MEPLKKALALTRITVAQSKQTSDKTVNNVPVVMVIMIIKN
jgi:hypothetical protein